MKLLTQSSPKQEILSKLQGPRLIGFDDQFRELRDLIDHTVSTGGSNSVLLLGPHGVGKSHLVNLVLEDIQKSSAIFRSDGLVVRLSGYLQTDDRLALKSITKQLNLENVIGDRVFGSFAEHLEFLLKSLNSGGRQSKPIVFVLEEFALFCGHHNQTLLYNLFDVAQSRAAPIIVVGLTTELDVVESLEKRVKSRFNHRIISMFPADNFKSYFEDVRSILTVEGSKDWNLSLNQVLSTKAVSKLFEEIFSVNNTIAFLKQFIFILMSRVGENGPITESDIKLVWSELRAPSELAILSGLTVLEMCLVIACKHLQEIYDGEPFNFEMAFHEYDKFATIKARQFKFERSVMVKAWETLAELEIVTPIDKSASSKVLKTYRLFELQVTPERILSAIDQMPQPVKEWASSVFVSAA